LGALFFAAAAAFFFFWASTTSGSSWVVSAVCAMASVAGLTANIRAAAKTREVGFLTSNRICGAKSPTTQPTVRMN
jgi:hypothetical protein